MFGEFSICPNFQLSNETKMFIQNWIINEDFNILDGEPHLKFCTWNPTWKCAVFLHFVLIFYQHSNEDFSYKTLLKSDNKLWFQGRGFPYVKIFYFVLVFNYQSYKYVSYKISSKLVNKWFFLDLTGGGGGYQNPIYT